MVSAVNVGYRQFQTRLSSFWRGYAQGHSSLAYHSDPANREVFVAKSEDGAIIGSLTVLASWPNLIGLLAGRTPESTLPYLIHPSGPEARHPTVLAVDPDWEGLGVGRDLICAGMGYSYGSGATSAYATTSNGRPRAVALWRGMGFAPYMTVQKDGLTAVALASNIQSFASGLSGRQREVFDRFAGEPQPASRDEGRSLKQILHLRLISDATALYLPADLLLQVAIRVLEALAELHEGGGTHGNVSTASIFIAEDGHVHLSEEKRRTTGSPRQDLQGLLELLDQAVAPRTTPTFERLRSLLEDESLSSQDILQSLNRVRRWSPGRIRRVLIEGDRALRWPTPLLPAGVEIVPPEKTGRLPLGDSERVLRIFGVREDPVDLRVYFHKPSNYSGARMILVLPGVHRDAANYREYVKNLARRTGALVVAPEPDERQFSIAQYQFAGIFEEGKSPLLNSEGVLGTGHRLVPEEARTGMFLAKIIDTVRHLEEAPQMACDVAAHSGGTMAAFRMVIGSPSFTAQINQLMGGNPSLWPSPTAGLIYPVGLEGLPDELRSDAQLQRLLKLPIVFYLGTEDTDRHDPYLVVSPKGDPSHPHLVETAGADRTGRLRLTRGLRVFSEWKQLAYEKGWDFKWRLVLAPGVGHDGRGMFDAWENPAGPDIIEWTEQPPRQIAALAGALDLLSLAGVRPSAPAETVH